jgi:hypothetical protein
MAASKEDLESWMHILLEVIGNVADGTNVLKAADEDDEMAMTPDEISNFIRMDTVCTFFFLLCY